MSNTKFIIENKERFPLCPNGETESYLNPFYTWEHRVTVKYVETKTNVRVFVVFINTVENTAYIEELVKQTLVTVEENSLFEDLLNFAVEEGFLNFMGPIMKAAPNRLVR